MEETGAPVATENPPIFENSSSRTKRSIIENDNSDNDEEYASSGFYVREKTDKSEGRTDESSNDSDKNGEKECNENGTSNDIPDNDNNTPDSLDSENDKGDKVSNKHDDNETSRDNEASGDNEASRDNDNDDEASNHSEVKSQEDIDPLADNDVEDEEPEKSTVEAEDQSDSDKSDKITNTDIIDKNASDADDKEDKKQHEYTDKDKSEDESNLKNTTESEKVESIDKIQTENNKIDVYEKSEVEHDDKDKEKSESKENDANDKKTSEKATKDVSILKSQLTKEGEPLPGTSRDSDDDQDAEEMEVEVDFDPSLLCPDISMDVDEAPVNTGNSTYGSSDDLLISRTTDVDEITGVEVQFDLTHEEMELRSRMYGTDNPVQLTKIHCTACNVHLGSALDGQANRFVHPLLKVLICKNCYHFYTSGEFEKDEDGSELYCRWCGQGGEVLCCSSCEFVFCKRCIKNNFGIKKFKEIRNSDDWNCYRCNMSQLQALRASCAEFWDYYRTQLAKASTMAPKDPTFMTTDFTKCCNQEQKNKDKVKSAVALRKRKRKDSEDPDFVPGLLEEPKKKLILPTNAVPTSTPGILVIRPTVSSASTQAKPMVSGSTALGGGQMFRVGNTTFRSRTPSSGLGYTVTRPKVSTSSTSPGYIKILPQRMATPRSQSPYTVVPPGGTRPTFTTVRPIASSRPGSMVASPRPGSLASQRPGLRPAINTVPPMKHEWFEKTVRAAARVNSNLSYTLTQLNRQQSQANSVESLAVVHNKLQEVLSTSINSLIQIRKNLRTEFIAGIKNIKFPAKPSLSTPPPMVPLSVKNQQDDDDVIIVSPTVSPTGGGSTQTGGTSSGLVLGSGISLTAVKKTPVSTFSPRASSSGISSSNTPLSGKPGGYLKVKSFSALQSVPSECITIPDDPPMVLDEKTGLVADPLEFCQVDMNDDENSNQSQRSQNSGKDIANNIAKDPSDTTKLKEENTKGSKKEMNDSKNEINEPKKQTDDLKKETEDLKKKMDNLKKIKTEDEQPNNKMDKEQSESKSCEEVQFKDKRDEKEPFDKKMDEKEEKNIEDKKFKETVDDSKSEETNQDKETTEVDSKYDEDEQDIETSDNEKVTKNGDASSEREEEKEIDEQDANSLVNFTYNTNEEPTAEVKKWLGVKVMIKKSRVVDEIVRAKSRVLNGDCDNGGS